MNEIELHLLSWKDNKEVMLGKKQNCRTICVLWAYLCKEWFLNIYLIYVYILCRLVCVFLYVLYTHTPRIHIHTTYIQLEKCLKCNIAIINSNYRWWVRHALFLYRSTLPQSWICYNEQAKHYFCKYIRIYTYIYKTYTYLKCRSWWFYSRSTEMIWNDLSWALV